MIFTEEENNKFESIWIKEYVNNIYGYAKSLSDDDYISYKIWEDQNWKKMYEKHLPDVAVFRGDNPNIIFHGGCLGCKSQRIHGITRCKGCEYFKFNGDKKNLFIDGEESETISEKNFIDIFTKLKGKKNID